MELKGKIINFLGDSITEGVGVTDLLHNRYDNIIKDKCELAKANNYGISGSRLAHQRMPSEDPRRDLCFCGRAYDMDRNADVVVVYGGINDYFHGDAPVGQKGDQTPATFWGAVWFLMTFLKKQYPDKPVVFMTPARCHYKGVPDTEPSARPMKLADAMPVAEYVNIIKVLGEEIGVHVLDLFTELPIDPKIEADRLTYTVDGLHFNDAGHRVLADLLISYLKAL